MLLFVVWRGNKMGILFNREWAMPSPDTFQIKPIQELADRYLKGKEITLDPFARNCKLAAITNDLNPLTTAESHMDAVSFLDYLLSGGLSSQVDVTLLDPPYSPRQISECYKSIGKPCSTKDTQNAALYKACKDRIAKLCKPNGIVITCGWNSSGMGKNRGFSIIEILLVACGGGIMIILLQ
jgi:hypothetical protein